MEGRLLKRLTALAASATLALSIGLLLVSFHAKPTMAATTLPSGFEERLVMSVKKPIALSFTPDGRMLVASQTGQLRVYKDGQLLETPALNIANKICSSNDRGLLGVAVDPKFSANGYVYVFYTHNKFNSCPESTTDPNAPVHRISRFVMSGDTVAPSSEKILVDNVPAGVHHNAGDLNFGKDGYLYAVTGDGNCDYTGDTSCGGQNDASRDTHILLGKVLRITRDGGIPSDNPYTGTDSDRCNVTGRTDPGKFCQETFASGLRNPFRFAFDPDAAGTRFFIGDVGQNYWEEIDEGEAGADYAWNLCEGNHDAPSAGSVDCLSDPYTPPIHEYHHDTGCESVTGGAFVPDGAWPAPYDDSYLYGDYVCGKILELTPKEGGGFTQTDFASGLAPGGPIEMVFGPHDSGKALYYATYANGGEIHRISYVGANRAPRATVTANPTSGAVPLNVDFDGSGSTDPDTGDTLTYIWDFGDGSPAVETTTPTTSHTYEQADTYTATLTVRDDSGAEDAATVRIDAGNAPPEPSIVSPAADKLYRVGEQITLQGTATDPQDGQLPESALSWEILQHHGGNHTHPYSSGTGSSLAITAPAPEDLLSTDEGNYLEIRLTATDSNGLSGTVTQELQPNRVNVTLESEPAGLSLGANDETFAAPHTLVSWEGYELSLNAPSPQSLAGTTYEFASWSDGGAQTHTISTGAQPSTYTATYDAAGDCTVTGTEASETLTGTSSADVICGLGGNDILRSFAGNDTLKGGDGNDKLFGGAGDDSFDGEVGRDTASFFSSKAAVAVSLAAGTATGEGSDTLVGIENLVGSKLGDGLSGSAANNKLTGGEGADELRGGAGKDTLTGGGGADNLYGEDGDDKLDSRDDVEGNDSLDGGAGTDACTTDAAEASIVSCEL